MAEKTSKNVSAARTKTTDDPAFERRMATLRNCRLVGACVGLAFTWVAVLTFNAADWPNPAVWPQAYPTNNACGKAGAWVAFQLLHYFGEGVYPILMLLTGAALARMARRQIGGVSLRVIGAVLLVTVTATVVALMHPNGGASFVEGRGGILGIAVATLLKSSFSTMGTLLVVSASLVVGLLLTIDDVLLAVPSWIGLASRKIRAVVLAAKVATTPQGRLTPVMIGAGNTAKPSPLPLRPVAASAPATVEVQLDDDEAAGNEDNGDAADEVESVDETATPETLSTVKSAGEDIELPPERQLIVKMLGKDRVEGKTAKSAWPTELGDYVLPPLSILRDPEARYNVSQENVVREKAAILEQTLAEFRIEVRVVEITTGPVITMFELELSAGTKVSQINSLANDIARALKAPAVRVVAPIPGKNTIGIEVPNLDKEKVRLKELIMLGGVKPTKMALPVFLGKNSSGDPLICDVATMPHMLIAGTTGSGKSVCINSLVMSILMTQRPDHVKMILVDPKMVELSIFKEIPHLMCPIVTDMQRAEMILQWATTKMDERYELLAEAGVRDIGSFNRMTKEQIYERFQPSNDEEKMKIPTHLPYIVIIIDELADLMMTSGKEVEHHLSRLAQKSRAVGIHLIVATQRPQANVVTGLIKSNLPCRVAFRVASRMDSRIVMDQNGAEVLMGEGDMLFLPPGSAKLVRAQGTWIDDQELRAVITDLSGKARPEFHHELQRLRPEGEGESGERDPLFDEAVGIIVQTRRGSVSLLQRRLEIGYSRASRLIDQMASAGIVGEYKGSQAREVLITDKEWEAIRRQRDTEVRSGGYRADMNANEDDSFGTADLDDEFSSRN
ncbi:MAG: DNA translocase FtsK 4TM domain-containing protein [Planctomycetes bacterium]|nr:DNA translocase FtsK 4TM domain-containing protein [Planctomycetota bacterium]